MLSPPGLAVRSDRRARRWSTCAGASHYGRRVPARTEVMARAAAAYGVSIWTIYRGLRELIRQKSVRRSDHGSTRAAPGAEMGRHAEIIAALRSRPRTRRAATSRRGARPGCSRRTV
jgi:hypothetical protein